MFVKRAGSIYSDYGTSCTQTSDNGIIISAVSSTNGMDVHCGLIKTDLNGTSQWFKLFQIGQYSLPQTVLQAKDEGFIVFGSATDSTLLNYNNHFLYLHKTDLNGNPSWDLQFALSANDIAVNLAHCKTGGYIASSIADYNLGTYPKAAITRISETGTISWSQIFTNIYGLIPQKVIELENGKICFIAYSGSFSPSPFNDILVSLLEPNGNLIWTKNIGTYYDDEPYALAFNSRNEIFITGRSYFLNRNWDSHLLKLDSTGNILKTVFVDAGTLEGEIMRCIIAEDSGSCVLLGDVGDFNQRDITFIKTDSNLNITSSKRYLFSTLFTNYPYEVFKTHDNGYVFTGDYRPPNAFRDAAISKTDNSGNVYCHNSTINFTPYNDSVYSMSVTLNPLTPVIQTRNSPSTIPNNTFNSFVDCAMPVGIIEKESYDKNILNYYPNPSTDIVYIETHEGLLPRSTLLYGIDGKLIEILNTGKTNSGFFIDFSFMSPGMYFLECTFNDTPNRIKIILQ
jgi:hypothetical protein